MSCVKKDKFCLFRFPKISFIIAIVTFAGFMPWIGDLGSSPAQAQEKRGFFSKLFGRPAPPPPPKTNKNNKKTKGTTKKKSATVAGAPHKLPVQKSEQAHRILVIGDFIAAHLAGGLQSFYTDNPDILIISQTQSSSGLVRDDYYNWPGAIEAIVTAQKPDMIILTLGANDRQSLRVDGQSWEYGNEEWNRHYRGRIEQMATRLTSHDLPWIWVGLPPFQKNQLNAAALNLNSYYTQAMNFDKARFVDIWRGFADDEGNFTFSGYDINGNPTRLRSSDGINFTTSGRAKLAFYADEAIQSLIKHQEDNISATDDETSIVPDGLDSRTMIMPQHTPAIPPQPLADMTNTTQDLAGAPHTLSRLSNQKILHPTFNLPKRERADYFFEN